MGKGKGGRIETKTILLLFVFDGTIQRMTKMIRFAKKQKKKEKMEKKKGRWCFLLTLFLSTKYIIKNKKQTQKTKKKNIKKQKETKRKKKNHFRIFLSSSLQTFKIKS